VNYLAHLYLAGDDDAEISGALLGDFVKGRLENLDLAPAIVDGIRLHRSVDSYTDAHPIVIRSRERFQDRRRVSGIIVDIAYDHFLATHWQTFAKEPLDDFCHDRYQRLLARMNTFPPRLRTIVPHMARSDWLGSYAELDNVAYALERIGRRLSQPDMLTDMLDDLERHYTGLEQDFMQFFPELKTQFARHDRLATSNT
jgi:acyl carrier protein phosphodiesterase